MSLNDHDQVVVVIEQGVVVAEFEIDIPFEGGVDVRQTIRNDADFLALAATFMVVTKALLPPDLRVKIMVVLELLNAKIAAERLSDID